MTVLLYWSYRSGATALMALLSSRVLEKSDSRTLWHPISISMLLGEYTDDIPRGLSLSDQHLPDALPIGLPSSLLERRPDMRQAEFKLRAANAQVGVAQTDLFPKIRLTSNYGFESDELSSILKSPAGFIAGSLLQPIFAMGKNKAKVKAAKARYEQEVYSYEKSVFTR